MTTPKKLNSGNSISMREFSAVAVARTRHERYASAWRATVAYFIEFGHTDGFPADYRCWRLLVAHGRAGRKTLRMTQLDAWRVVLDVLHVWKMRGEA